MMSDILRVHQLRIEGVRNVRRLHIELADEQNLIVGGNGQGKTTILEAMYCLGAIRSFRGARVTELIQHGVSEAFVHGHLGVRDPLSEVNIAFGRKGRKIKVDGKKPELSHHFSRFPMVAFHPGDLELVFGGPSVRRRFLDRMLFQAESGYAQWFREYRRALSSRNELLKQDATDMEIGAYDRVLSALGARMGQARARLTIMLSEAAAQVMGHLGVEPFSINLQARVEPDEGALFQALSRALRSDRRRCRTSVGPHTDDLELARPTGLARVVASRGEARALSVSLRLAERKVIARCAGAMPLLLLDDVWAELDGERAERVLTLVADEPGQVVVTGTGGSEPGIVSGWRRFHVVSGEVAELSP